MKPFQLGLTNELRQPSWPEPDLFGRLQRIGGRRHRLLSSHRSTILAVVDRPGLIESSPGVLTGCQPADALADLLDDAGTFVSTDDR